MRLASEWAVWMGVVLVWLLVSPVGTVPAHAGNISVTIDGQAPQTPSQGSCTNAATCVNIGGTYGVLQVSPVSGNCDTTSPCARIDVPVNEITVDNLQLTNTRITNNDQSNDKSFTILFEREDVQQPNTTKWYNTYLNGNFGAVAGNSISSQTFYKKTGETYVQVGSTLTHTVICSSSCSTPFSKKTGAQKNPSTSLRWVRIELTITLKAGSFVDLNSGAKITTSNSAPDLCATLGSDFSDLNKFKKVFDKCILRVVTP